MTTRPCPRAGAATSTSWTRSRRPGGAVTVEGVPGAATPTPRTRFRAEGGRDVASVSGQDQRPGLSVTARFRLALEAQGYRHDAEGCQLYVIAHISRGRGSSGRGDQGRRSDPGSGRTVLGGPPGGRLHALADQGRRLAGLLPRWRGPSPAARTDGERSPRLNGAWPGSAPTWSRSALCRGHGGGGRARRDALPSAHLQVVIRHCCQCSRR